MLAEELGVDPSPQTRAAHLKVLQPVPARPVEAPFVGRASELHWLSTVLDDVRRTPGATPVVVLSGHVGSGRHRLAVTACQDDGLPWVDVRPGQSVQEAALGARGRALLWRLDPAADADQLARLVCTAEPLEGPAVLLALLPCAGELAAVDEVLHNTAVRSLQLPPLLLDDVEALAQRVLSGLPMPSLAAELHVASGGLPGRALELLEEWRAGGRLTATSRGLALAPRAGEQEQDPSGRRALARALPRLEGDALEALQLSALLDQSVTPSLLVPLLAEPGAVDDAVLRARATAALEQLVDLGLLRNSSVRRRLAPPAAARRRAGVDAPGREPAAPPPDRRPGADAERRPRRALAGRR